MKDCCEKSNPLVGACSPRRNRVNILWGFFSLFIFYGALIPFAFDITSESITTNISAISWVPFIDPDGTRASIPDVVQNILFFLPFGFLGFFSGPKRNLFRIILVTCLGFCLSLGVESFQLLTVNRITSATDITTNTIGSFLGASIALLFLQSFLRIERQPFFQKCQKDVYFPAVLIAVIVVIISTCEPFDFSLDVGMVGSRIKSFLKNPIQFQSFLFYGDAIVLLRFVLFGYIISLWFWEKDIPGFSLCGWLVSSVIGIGLEGLQLIISSRMPSLQDAIIVLFGSFLGAMLAIKSLPDKPRLWAIIILLTTCLSVGIEQLSPFRWTSYHGFQWIPFLPYYTRTLFVAFSDFIGSILAYFPLGFILQYLYPNKKYSLIILGVIAMVLGFSFEFAQGWVESRYADVTDSLGAIIGTVIGGWICLQWIAKLRDDKQLVG